MIARYLARIVGAAAFLLSAVPQTADATNYFTTCDNCTLQQYMNKAKSYGEGIVYVIDKPQLRLRLYEVIEDSPGYFIADPVTVPSDIQQHFLLIMEAEAELQEKISVEVDANDTYPTFAFPYNPFGAYGDSAHGVVQSNNTRNNLGDNFGIRWWDQSAFGDAHREVVSVLLASAGAVIGQPIGYTFILTFEDGSKATFELTSEDVTRAKYKPGSAIDSDGNSIPDSSITNEETRGDYVGEYYFSSLENRERWVSIMSGLYNIPVTGPTPSGSESRIRCSWDPNDPTNLQCEYI